MKKVFLPIIAFVIGTIVSISIQACADNFEEPSRNNSSSNSSSSSSSSSSSNDKYSAWTNTGIGSYTIYNEQGEITTECKNTFNSKGWIEKYVVTYYNVNSYGNMYKSGEIVTTYTYSSTGDVRYGTTVYTYYNESGQIWQTQRTTDEYRLKK